MWTIERSELIGAWKFVIKCVGKLIFVSGKIKRSVLPTRFSVLYADSIALRVVVPTQ